MSVFIFIFTMYILLLLCANGYRFTDCDMFAQFTGIGIGHKAVLLERHAHELANDSLHTDDDNKHDEDSKECSLGSLRAPLEDTGEDKDMDEDKMSQDGNDSNSSVGYASDDGSSYICF